MLNKGLLIAFFFIVFYAFRLDYPHRLYFDEFFYVPAARNLLHLSAYSSWPGHPPLGKLLIAGSIRIFGDNPVAWRLPSLVLGGCATALAGYLAFLFSGSWLLFLLTSLLLSLDGLWITQARIALLNAPMVFFILLTLVLWRHGDLSPAKRSGWWLAAAISAGLAAACKWQGALVILIPPVFYLLSKKEDRPADSIKPLWVFYLFLVMLAVYFATFLIVLFIPGYGWKDIWLLQFKIPAFHLHDQPDIYRYKSAWYTWPFLLRPVWYGFQRENPGALISEQTVNGIICLGNPVLFLLIFPAIFWLAKQWRRFRDPLAVLVLSGFFIFWIPSAFVSRCTIFNHFYPVIPFAFIGIAAMTRQMLNSAKTLRVLAASIIVAMAALCFVFFYPLWVGMSIPDYYYQMHLWLPWWI